MEAVELLLERAQEAGSIRCDVVASDIGFLINAVGRAGLSLDRSATGVSRRYVGILLDGLRPEGARELAAALLSREQLHAAKVAQAGPGPRSAGKPAR